MLPLEHSAILSTFIKLPVVIKTFVWSIFEWPFYTGFTAYVYIDCMNVAFTHYTLEKLRLTMGNEEMV